MERITSKALTPLKKGRSLESQPELKENTVPSEPGESVSLSPKPAPQEPQVAKPPEKPEAQDPPVTAIVQPGFTDQPIVLENESVSEVGEARSLAEVAAEVSRSSEPKKAEKTPTLPAPTRSLRQQRSLIQKVGRSLLGFLTSDPLSQFQGELNTINALEADLQKELKTPQDFLAKKKELQAALKAGATLEEIRPVAYAVAREACRQATGMRPYDCQVTGALAMDNGYVAEMRTGEGKTLTAVMPLYLNALTEKGAHLVTVNGTLAARDAEWMGPAYELLGMKVGVVLEDMTREQKKAGYNADITYTTDRALGFDYLRDRTAQSPSQRVQRDLHYALVDEVDEVLIDEAQTPLIISGLGEEAPEEYKLFNEIVETMVVGDDYHVDPKRNSTWVTDSGMAWVESRLALRELDRQLKTAETPEERARIEAQKEQCHTLGKMVREEQKLFNEYRALEKTKPGLVAKIKGAEWEEEDDETLEAAQMRHLQAQAEREAYAETAPTFSLFDEENAHRNRYLNAAVKAHGLFEKDKQYMVMDDAVQIVDKNKGRTADGRRYNDGLHQALEAKEAVTIKPEQKTIASITYPNLFKKFERLSGMSGTARTSDLEFHKLYDLSVVQVPTNKPVIRKDEDDLVFRTLEEKYEAVARDAANDFFDGKPVLIGTLSVEHNEWVAKKLAEAGVPKDSLQVLNAETVRGDKERENSIIANAGRSGIITVATNMAGRGANIKPDLINYMELTRQVNEARAQGKPVVITMEKKKQADWMDKWLAQEKADIVPADQKGQSEAPLQIRYLEGVEQPLETNPNAVHFKGEDFPTDGLTVYGTERALSRRIDDQLIGRAGRQGAPGRSKFYLSLEDDLLRVFGSKLDAVAGLFMKPGEGISSGILDRLILEAQSSVEMNAFSAREKTNKTDEVLDMQRETFFTYRDEVMEGEEVRPIFQEMVGRAFSGGVLRYLPDKKKVTLGEVREAVKKAEEDLKHPIDLPFLDPKLGRTDKEKIKTEDLEHELLDLADRKTSSALRTAEKTMPNLDTVIRSSVLEVMNQGWSGHLDEMEALRQGVQWQSLAQKDPEVEFKLRGFDVFENTIANIDAQVVSDVLVGISAYADMMKKVT